MVSLKLEISVLFTTQHESFSIKWKIFKPCLPIAKNISLTFIAVLADVSINNNPFSSAYCLASSNSTTRLFVKSALLPAKAITMFGEAF